LHPTEPALGRFHFGVLELCFGRAMLGVPKTCILDANIYFPVG
jgi:hypothetical protein